MMLPPSMTASGLAEVGFGLGVAALGGGFGYAIHRDKQAGGQDLGGDGASTLPTKSEDRPSFGEAAAILGIGLVGGLALVGVGSSLTRSLYARAVGPAGYQTAKQLTLGQGAAALGAGMTGLVGVIGGAAMLGVVGWGPLVMAASG